MTTTPRPNPRPWLSPAERRRLLRPWAWAGAIALALFLVALLIDPAAHRWAPGKGIEDRSWYQFLRTFGAYYTWLAIALALVLHDLDGRRRGLPGPARPRGLGLVLAATLGGLAAEVLKVILRRERPDPEHAVWTFRSFLDGPLDSSGLGLPSSHTAVAFAGACFLAALLPWARWLVLGLAVGCAATRVLADAHWVSDTVLGAFAGWASARLVFRWLHPPSGTAWLP